MNVGLIAQTSNNINDLFSPSAQIEWNRFYQGTIASVHDCELQLAFDGFNCKGFLNIPSSEEAFVLEGSLEDGNLQLVEKYKGQAASYVNGKIKENKIQLSWQPIGGEIASEASFVSKNELLSKGDQQTAFEKENQEGNYYDFHIDKRVNLPSTKHSKFQSWIKNQVKGFQNEIDSKIKNTNLNRRFQILAVIDHELFFESEEIVNGELIYYSSWSKPQRINFVYDLRNNKEIKFDQLAINPETYEAQLKQLIFSQAKMEDKLKLEGYKAWLESVNVQDIKWIENGMVFSTSYDPIYGKETIEVDCDNLKNFINKKYLKKLACQNGSY